MDDVASSAPGSQKRIPCEVYSRIVGYLRPVQNWNKGKQQEFAERRTYDMPDAESQLKGEPSLTSEP